ncbi:hypothetical protein H5410_036864 [Solanum commersonii]|uniref:Secreted protein n=1 Tax=Solanum commersonii TaxID=4109 RepID=A0A9J5Y7U2_SOLCO|nr:hypothetical protein H5410_036864 [Solanum commersonii]
MSFLRSFSRFVPFCLIASKLCLSIQIRETLDKTQVQQFKKDVSNSATQDSIMNVHNKAQFTHARINCILKDSSYDTPLSKILNLTILDSNERSSSTKVFKCPHTKE